MSNSTDSRTRAGLKSVLVPDIQAFMVTIAGSPFDSAFDPNSVAGVLLAIAQKRSLEQSPERVVERAAQGRHLASAHGTSIRRHV
jgi:hypothetical protein